MNRIEIKSRFSARRKGIRGYYVYCPFCGEAFYDYKDLIDHQDDEDHVIEVPVE